MNAADMIQLVVFRVGDQEFACEILQVERVLRYEKPAPMPKAPLNMPKVSALPFNMSRATSGMRAETALAPIPKAAPRRRTSWIFGDMVT